MQVDVKKCNNISKSQNQGLCFFKLAFLRNSKKYRKYISMLAFCIPNHCPSTLVVENSLRLPCLPLHRGSTARLPDFPWRSAAGAAGFGPRCLGAECAQCGATARGGARGGGTSGSTEEGEDGREEEEGLFGQKKGPGSERRWEVWSVFFGGEMVGRMV